MSYVCRLRAVCWRPWRVTWPAWRGGSPGPGAPHPPRGDTGEGRDTSQAGHSNTTNPVLAFILCSIFIYFIFILELMWLLLLTFWTPHQSIYLGNTPNSIVCIFYLLKPVGDQRCADMILNSVFNPSISRINSALFIPLLFLQQLQLLRICIHRQRVSYFYYFMFLFIFL